jgi:manganese/iron transport system permease protein
MGCWRRARPQKGMQMADLLMPFQFPFMQNAFWAALILAPPTAVLSCYLVLKGWSLMGDAIAHATLPGIVTAYIFGIPLLIGAFLAGLFCAVSIGYLDANSRVKRDTIMGIVFSGMFGLGIVMYTQTTSDLHLDHILFGNILGLGAMDLASIALISVAVLGVLALRWRDLMLHAFDPTHARALGLNVTLLHYGFLVLLSATIVATLKSVGLILAIGLLIAPGAIAFLLTRQFQAMIAVSVLVTLASMLGGVYLSFWLDAAPAPTIILLLSAIFVLAFAFHSVLARREKLV